MATVVIYHQFMYWHWISLYVCGVYLSCVYSVGAVRQSSGMRLDGPVGVGLAWDWVVWFCRAALHWWGPTSYVRYTMYACRHTYAHKHTHMHMYTHIHMQTHTHTQHTACLSSSFWAETNKSCAHVHTDMCTHAHIHTHTHKASHSHIQIIDNVQIHTASHMHVHAHTPTHERMHTHKHACPTCTHTHHTRAHTHASTHTHLQRDGTRSTLEASQWVALSRTEAFWHAIYLWSYWETDHDISKNDKVSTPDHFLKIQWSTCKQVNIRQNVG